MSEYHIFPFGLVEKDSNIVIYGMGDVGHQYVEQILTTQFCRILFAVDKNYLNIKNSFIQVTKPDKIKESNPDYVVIANASPETADSIIKTVVNLGVDTDRIIWKDMMCSVNNCKTIDVGSEMLKLRKSIDSVLVNTSYIRRMERVLLSLDSYAKNEILARNGQLNDNKYYSYFKTIKDMVKEYICPYDLCRIGKHNDGGYVLADYFVKDKIAYSFGISNDVSWDRDMAERNFEVFMYDHTINGLPESNARFHFFKLGITGEEEYNKTMYSTLKELMTKNNHLDKKNMILKMDVEGAEWSFLESISEEILGKFSQIVFELHGVADYSLKDKVLNGLHKLEQTHKIIHVHANNYSKVEYFQDMIMPDVIEVTYLAKTAFLETDMQLSSKHRDQYDEQCWKTRSEVEFIW